MSTTKPGSLLKTSIPVRTFTPWEEERPGFLEIDLVAHWGTTTEGQYLNTLTCTDLCTGWTDVAALLHRSQEAVSEAIRRMRTRLPFPLLGIDSDDGGEFINGLLYRYYLAEQITFTRSRPYQKNDQAHGEQKNWSVVRHTVGYDRWETQEELRFLEMRRAHWGLETGSHYRRDVTLQEDATRFTIGQGARILANINNLTLALI